MTLSDADRSKLGHPRLCARGAPGAKRLAAGWAWFDAVNAHSGGEEFGLAAALAAPRAPLLGLSWDRPRVMGVINVTPDSFSDGGRLADAAAAVSMGREMVAAGADILDVGGESTLPGAEPTALDDELARVIPVIEGLAEALPDTPLSIDTRKAAVARAAFEAGARLFNDVSALTHDPASPETAAELIGRHGGAVCLMHAQGDPQTMQDAPRYGDVLAEVAAFLSARMDAAEAAGAPRSALIIDPGIGFGKTLEHNLALLNGLGALQSLGAPLLLGVSRKRFIGALSGEAVADRRLAGSLTAALHGVAQGAQILRVHDVAETVQALRVWRGLNEGSATGGPTAMRDDKAGAARRESDG